MKLRRLEEKDAELMLEWMHDENVIRDLQLNFSSKKKEDCDKFIKQAYDDEVNVHLAMVDDMDNYLGTVSLKNIDSNQKSAEFAIVIRSCAMGMGVSEYGMKEIIKLGFEKFNLKKIYWCVSPKNTRALKFYDKNKFNRVTTDFSEMTKYYTKNQVSSYIWYMVEQ